MNDLALRITNNHGNTQRICWFRLSHNQSTNRQDVHWQKIIKVQQDDVQNREAQKRPEPRWETYRVAKAALKNHSQQWCRSFRENKVKFRTSLLTLDRLDTALSRSRSNWTGNGIDLRDIMTYVDLIICAQPNTCIEEIRAWVNLDHKQ